jgi:hypothetical protein
MTAKVSAGTIVFHNWDPIHGLVENELRFDSISIDELFTYCLEIRPEETVDRVMLDGVDRKGIPRRLTLAFQSATVSELPSE